MLRVRDYTRLSPADKFEGQDIAACDHCGRPALLEEVEGKKWFTHSETIGFDDAGQPIMEWKTCPSLIPEKTPEQATYAQSR